MPCGAYPNHPIEYWLDFRFVDGTVCAFGDQIGVSVTMLMFFGVTFLALYQSTNSVLVPVAVLIVLAPLVVALLPAIGFQFATVVMVLGLAVVGYFAYLAA